MALEFFLALVIKHFVVDLGMQQYMGTRDKHEWLGNGHRHYFEHAVVTAFIALWFVPKLAIPIAVLDYVLHWHIDYSKHHINRWLQFEPRTQYWWWLMVVDQIAHMLTYYALAKMFM
jgi:hypothetical protein